MKQLEFAIVEEGETSKHLTPENQDELVKLMAQILLKFSSQKKEEIYDVNTSENY